jgi:hypothetical protein
MKMKIFFLFSLLLLLFFIIWFFFFKKKIIHEMFLLEYFDNNANISKEPDEAEDSKKTGLYLKGNNPEDIQSFVVQTVGNALQVSQNNQVRGPPGEKGSKGDDGKNGGLYTNKGPLRSAKFPDMVVERTYGTGEGAKSFLTGQTYLPQQTWTLGTDNKICSGYNENECLTMSEKGNVYMMPKQMATDWVHSRTTGQLQNKYRIGGNINCLTAKKKGSTSANHKVPDNGKPPQGKPTPLTNAYVLESAICSGDLNQSWAFY